MTSGYDKYGCAVTPDVGATDWLWLALIVVAALTGALGWIFL